MITHFLFLAALALNNRLSLPWCLLFVLWNLLEFKITVAGYLDKIQVTIISNEIVC